MSYGVKIIYARETLETSRLLVKSCADLYKDILDEYERRGEGRRGEGREGEERRGDWGKGRKRERTVEKSRGKGRQWLVRREM